MMLVVMVSMLVGVFLGVWLTYDLVTPPTAAKAVRKTRNKRRS